VAVCSPTLFLDIALSAGEAFPLPLAEERAVYVVDGDAQLDGFDIPPGRMVVLDPQEEPMLSADADARVVLIGGAPLGPRQIWWNFVSSRRERIVQAADDWAAQRLGGVPGETECIPLPDKRPT
jgi:redox-sensitive bicupin YhaK (pirin superfamily)